MERGKYSCFGSPTKPDDVFTKAAQGVIPINTERSTVAVLVVWINRLESCVIFVRWLQSVLYWSCDSAKGATLVMSLPQVCYIGHVTPKVCYMANIEQVVRLIHPCKIVYNIIAYGRRLTTRTVCKFKIVMNHTYLSRDGCLWILMSITTFKPPLRPWTTALCYSISKRTPCIKFSKLYSMLWSSKWKFQVSFSPLLFLSALFFVTHI